MHVSKQAAGHGPDYLRAYKTNQQLIVCYQLINNESFLIIQRPWVHVSNQAAGRGPHHPRADAQPLHRPHSEAARQVKMGKAGHFRYF